MNLISTRQSLGKYQYCTYFVQTSVPVKRILLKSQWLNVAVQGQSVKRVTWNSDIFSRVEIVPPQIRAQVILSLKYLQPKLDRIYFTEN